MAINISIFVRLSVLQKISLALLSTSQRRLLCWIFTLTLPLLKLVLVDRHQRGPCWPSMPERCWRYSCQVISAWWCTRAGEQAWNEGTKRGRFQWIGGMIWVILGRECRVGCGPTWWGRELRRIARYLRTLWIGWAAIMLTYSRAYLWNAYLFIVPLENATDVLFNLFMVSWTCGQSAVQYQQSKNNDKGLTYLTMCM